MLGKMVQVTDGCGFVGELREKMLGKTFEVKKVYWEEGEHVAIGLTVEGYEPCAGDGYWCIVYPTECEIVEDTV
jgi:hypothetical protein